MLLPGGSKGGGEGAERQELAWLPVESLIRERQSESYAALGTSDRLAEATPLVEFMLTAIRDALEVLPSSSPVNDPVNDPVSDPVKLLIQHLGNSEELAAAALRERLNLKLKPAFRNNYLNPALASGVIEMTQPGSPNSPVQRYRLTPKGRRLKS